MSTNTNFNHNMFRLNINAAYFVIMELKREDHDFHFHIDTNKYDEDVIVHIFKNENVIEIIAFKEGQKYYKSIEGGNKYVQQGY